MNKKRWIVLIIFIPVVMVSIGFYYQTHLSIWGFSISKNEIKDVIINTNEEVYIITNRDVVLEVAELVSKMEKPSKVMPYNFPPEGTCKI